MNSRSSVAGSNLPDESNVSRFVRKFVPPLEDDASANNFDEQLLLSQLDYVRSSRAMGTTLAENYTGLPYDADWCYA